MCKHSHFECTCHNVRMSKNTNVNMYKNAEVYRNKCVCEKPMTCGIKAGICLCAGIKSTHGYAWYGRACAAPSTCNVVCMCGKIHAQESEKNNNNKSNKIIRLGRNGWGKNVCQETCCKAVDRATCMCVCMCTANTGKWNSRVFVAPGAARRGGECRNLRAAVGLQGHLSASNWETVVVTMSVRVIAMIVGRGQAATQTAVTLPGTSQS